MTAILAQSELQLGLGCSRLGSINGTSGQEARELLQTALDQGVRFFDTANIYAQGDSERYLGEVIGDRTDCVICSKGGKYVSYKRRMFMPMKGLMRIITRMSSGARDGLAKVRSKPMPTRWDGPFLTQSLEASLRRLKRSKIDIYMLHSPSAAVIRQGEAVTMLEAARIAGKIGHVGVSADDVEAVAAALDDPRVTVIQLPLHVGDDSYDALITRACQQSVAIVAREILSGLQTGTNRAEFVGQRIADTVARGDIAVTLVGTTKLPHLKAAITAARS